MDLGTRVRDVLSEEIQIDFGLLVGLRAVFHFHHLIRGIVRVVIVVIAHVQVENVLGQSHVVIACFRIADDENAIESTQNRRLQFDLFFDTLHVIVTTENRIGCCEHGATRVQTSRDAGFRNTNRLLFHCFVDCNSIFRTHLIELVNANHTAVS